MNAAFMQYEQADRDGGRAGPGSREPARTHQHQKPRDRETARPRDRETARHESTLDPGFHDVSPGPDPGRERERERGRAGNPGASSDEMEGSA